VSYRQVSVVLPVWRQATFIDGVVRSYLAALEKLPFGHEVLLILNGDCDDTMCQCRALAAEFETVTVHTSDPPGWGHAVWNGVAAARGDLICYTNSARTRAEDLALCILYASTFPGTVIKAERQLRDSIVRRIGSVIYNLECRALFNLAVFDVNGTPKVFPADYEGLRNLTRHDDLIDAEFNIVCREAGYPMLEVPIFGVKRHGERSSTKLRSAIKMYAGLLSLAIERRKIRRPS